MGTSPTFPTLTADLRRGDESHFWGELQKRGIMPYDVAEAGKDNATIDEIVAAILKRRLFATPEEQIATLFRINEVVWNDPTITMDAIRALGDPPVSPTSDAEHLWCTVLLRETGDAVRTFAENWAACQFIHKTTWKWDGLVLTPEGVRVRAGAIARPTGLRWATIELGRTHKGRAVKAVRLDLDRATTMGMGQELPLIGALHPKWARAMNGDKIPFVDAPDLEVRPNADAARSFSGAPCLDFDRGTGGVWLGADGVGGPYSRFGSGVLGE